MIEADKIMREIDNVDGQNLCPKKCQKLEGAALRWEGQFKGDVRGKYLYAECKEGEGIFSWWVKLVAGDRGGSVAAWGLPGLI